MSDDRLTSLSRVELPEPSAEARRRALAASLAAFEAAEEQKSSAAPQGKTLGERLRSIVQLKRGTWIMDTRLTYGLGTAAVALLLLPLGYQFYTSTALTPVDLRVTGPGTITEPQVPPPPTTLEQPQITALPPPARPEPTPELREREVEELASKAAEPMMLEQLPAGESQRNMGVVTMAPQDGGAEMDMSAAPMVAAEPMYDAIQPSAMPLESGDEFTDFAESPVKSVAEEPVSTFSIDVDTASYAYVRRMLNEGYVPEPDAVRIEELINYFSYDYPGPETADTPFEPSVAVYPTPWNAGTQLLHIGIKGYVPPADTDVASNLTFLIDTSGSMDGPDRIELLKRSFALLVNQLTANDTVSMVVYAGSAGVVLEPTKATDKAKILAALDNLYAGGSTAGAEGIELAYRLAEQSKIPNGVNRVILATDGDFNVGISDPDQLIDFVKEKRDSGVFLSVLGFGMGNYQDDTMQALAQNGNGNAAYIDSFREAQKVLVAEGGGTLETIAKDVKIQIEFNPAVVSEYRLVGYETRALNREDFNNDKVDAGDIGAGHTVTAIYEITPVGSDAALVDPLRYGGGDTPTAALLPAEEIGFLKLRYKLPEDATSKLIELPIGQSLVLGSLQNASTDQRFAAAVAAFGQKLKGSNYGDMDWAEIRSLAQSARGEDESGHRAEFIQLIDLAASLSPDRVAE